MGRERATPPRWLPPLLHAAGALLLAAGGALLWLGRGGPGAGDGISGELLPGLEPAERIEAAPGSLSGWNVLLVSFDTTRADHLGAYGNRSIHTPVLDGLAREGVLFANATTPVPATLPAHASLLTGLYPFRHGARANGTFRLEPDQLTLAEILSARGFRTGAAISAYVLDSSYGLAQGFDLYHDDLSRGTQYAPQMFRERAAELTNEPVSEWLAENGDEPFFLWVHYFDPHAPYLPPEPYRSDYAGDPYDGEIAYADQQLGELLARLDELGVRERTLVVMTADHGEGLGEHGEQTHSLLLYDSTLRVPLILHAPGALPRGVVVERQVSLVDVVPTLLDLLGIDAPHPFDGTSLLHPPPPGARAVYIETLSTMTLHGWAPLLGVRRDDAKYVLAPRPELYDLGRDPGELENLHASRAELAASLHGALTDFVGDDPLLAAQVAPNLEVDAEARSHLAALGYVATRGGAGGAAAAPIDPKDGVHHWERVQRGVHQRNAGDLAGAIETLEGCLAEVPGDIFALQILAGAYQIQGRHRDALAVIERAEALEPSDPTLPLIAGAALLRLGDLEGAEARVQRVLSLRPGHAPAYLQLASLARLRRQPERALEWLQEALRLDRGARRAVILNELASFQLQRGQRDAARRSLEEALEVDAFHGEALAGLAEILWEEGDEGGAVAKLQAALRFNPLQPRALAVLCGIASEQGHLEVAIAQCQRALEIAPTFGAAHANLGLALRRKGELERAEEVYRAGLERSPGYDALHQNLAQLLLRLGRTEEAVEEFEAALRANPRNRVALANLGVHHMNASRPGLARRFLQRALRVDPDYAFAHKQLGVLLLAQEQRDAALRHFQRSLEIDPSQPDAGKMRFHLDRARVEPD